MPLAPTPLLQAASVAKTQSAVASNAVKPAETGKDNAPSFARVYSRQAESKPAVSHDKRAKTVNDKPVTVSGKPAADNKAAASTPAVADSGKSLPADPVSKKTDDANGGAADAAATDGKATDPTVSAAAPVDPTLDPAALQALAQQPPEPAAPVAAAPVPPVEVPVVVAATVAPQQQPAAPATNAAFDPASDPLAGLAAVQVALAQNGKTAAPDASSQASAQGSTSASGDSKTSTAQSDVDPLLTVVNNLTVPVDQQPTDNASAGAGDKAFKGLIEDGLKDSKSAAADTRVDDFANRLAALSQAVQPKEATASAASPLTQPLAMHQSGWSEAVVDRVMYLSSQNLKSADIQLEPAELGRLDIRVNMAPDQQTQVTFMSAHPGVREALEGQMSKLRDSFTQQGLGQVDVSVSDQSRGWNGQGQNQQQQANQGQRSGGATGGGSGQVDGLDDGSIREVAQVSQPMTVIGSSQVDYYA